MGREERRPQSGGRSGPRKSGTLQEGHEIQELGKCLQGKEWRLQVGACTRQVSFPLDPSSPDQAAYLSGKEAFGPVFAQGCQAARPRTLARTDGLLSCRQNFIQFV